MLKQRILTAILLGPAVLAIIWYGNTLAFTTLIALISFMICYEWCQIVRNAKVNSLIVATVITTCIFLFEYSTFIVIETERIFISAIILWMICLFWLFNPQGGKDKYTVKYALGVGVLLLFAASMLTLHKMAPNGHLITLFLFLLIWIADIGAYVSGKSFGKHKLARQISPGKTIEGLIGALIFTAVFGYFVAGWFNQDWLYFVIAFPLIAIVSVIGDLFASFLKRQAQVKDSGNLLPGHGGFLDRFDSLIAASPFYFAFIHFLKL